MSRKKIAVFIASIDREYQQDFTAALASATSGSNVDICIFNTQGHMNVEISSSEAGESMIYGLPDLDTFDGIISLPATMGNEIALNKVMDVLKPVAKSGKPHVSIDVPQENAVCIQFDDQVSVSEIIEHMIEEHGARRFAFVTGPADSPVSAARVNACMAEMRKHGLEPDNKLVFSGEWTRVGGRRAAEQILEPGGELPDAVICANDDMALSVIECFNERGIMVPQDVAVTGFDALREALLRGLTTVRRPINRSARKAIEVLCKWIDGEVPESRTIILPTIPIYGETCGCIQNNEHVNEKLRALGTERWNMETILTRVSMFSGSMAGVGDEAEAAERIDEFVESWGIRKMFLCVDPSICRNIEGREFTRNYPEEMLLLFGKADGERIPSVMFPTKDLIPEDRRKPEDQGSLVFCPLYYRDRNFGYVAIELGSGTGSALYSVLMLLNGALMSLYLQTNIRRYASTIESMAVHDIMTGMLNRRGFMEQAPKVMEQAGKEGKYFVMISVDMDHMKFINDEYGHLTGDEAIGRMGKALRILETRNMTPVHISGDEFLAYGISDSLEDAQGLIDVVNAEMDRINRNDPWICDISASLGVYAAIPDGKDDMDQFLTRADRAMYAEKNRKKHRT